MTWIRNNRIYLLITVFLFVLTFGTFTPGLGNTDGLVYSQNIAGEIIGERANEVVVGGVKNDGVTPNIKPKKIDVWTRLGSFLGNFMLQIASYVTWIGGKILDTSIDQFVVNMGTLVNVNGVGVAIDGGWKIVRDVGNIFFIFGFIWIGIRTIIDYSSANTKRFLSQLIIAALLINFSLFFTKVVIDVGNILAVEIYDTILTKSGIPENSNLGIGAALASKLGIVGIYNTTAANSTNTLNPETSILGDLTTGGNISYFFGAALVLILAGFVFAAGGILIAIRFGALVFLMIGSPILFAAMVFPQTQKYASILWKKIFSYAFFAPLYLFLLLMTLQVVDSFPKSGSGEGFFTALTGMGQEKQFGTSGAQAADAFSVITFFILTMILLILALNVAKQLGNYGGAQAVAFGNHLRKGAQGVLGRMTIGRAGNYFSRKQEEYRTSGNRAKRYTGMALTGIGATSIANSARDTKFGSSLSRGEEHKQTQTRNREISLNTQTGSLLNQIRAGIDAPAGPAGDAARIAMEQAVRGASTPTFESMSQKERESVAHLMSANQIEGLRKSEKLDAGQGANVANARSAAIAKRFDSGVAKLSNATSDELSALGYDYLSTPKNAAKLSSSQLGDLKKNTKDFGPTAFAGIAKVREAELLRMFAANPASVFTPDRKDKDRAQLPIDILTDPRAVPHFDTNTLKQMLHEDSVTAADRQTIRTNMMSYVGPATPQVTKAIGYLLSLKGGEF